MPVAHERHIEREHERQTHPRDGETDTIERLRAERDELRDLITAYPARTAELIRHHEHEAAEFADGIGAALMRGERLRAELQQMGKRQRRGERGRSVTQRLGIQERLIESMKTRREKAHAEAERLRSHPESPERWEAEHPSARERLHSAERAFDHAVDRAASQQIKDPGEHITRVLGERPHRDQVSERETWERGAKAIERYRIAYEIDSDERTALGPRPERGARSYDRLSAFQEAGSELVEAREHLGIALPGLGPIEKKLTRIVSAMPERDIERSRDVGRGR